MNKKFICVWIPSFTCQVKGSQMLLPRHIQKALISKWQSKGKDKDKGKTKEKSKATAKGKAWA